ncbi:MAG: transketolase [Clostridiales bacterium]|jgi:transketolase|nr:transketolase [Clostridiales bacterium]
MSQSENQTISAIRFLAADAVQKANSGHPGLPLGAAPAAYTLWAKHLRHNPKNPKWQARDRFVLSAGHGSSLLYSLLHIFGYGLSLDDMKSFRQAGSLTPGHPEYRHTPGVEVTTGPLGQGIANAVGFAMAEAHTAAVFNTPDFKFVDNYTYALCGDGCLMEGIAHEAVSLAGTLRLNKLILLYDSNGITIEGSTGIAFREDVRASFTACGWNALLVEDGNDVSSIDAAIAKAKTSDKPTIIEVKTIIGYGAPNKQGKQSAHGEPLGAEELSAAKKNLGYDHPPFTVTEEVRAHMDSVIKGLEALEADYNKRYDAYRAKNPEAVKKYEDFLSGKLPDLLNNEDFWTFEGNLATRVSSETVLNKVCALVPSLFGGSADLAPSTKTLMKGRGDFSAETPEGSNVHFGIREHAMTAIANGIALYAPLIPYVSGFFVFSDYMKPAMRISALMGLRVINILTHDSIGVGEDGPTHQPIEQLAALRSIPNFTVVRPCDSNETAAAWYIALNNTNGPTALALTRQNLKLLPESGKGALKGAYILKDSEKAVPDVLLMASGSEVGLIYDAWEILRKDGVDARVVSMPSWEVFEKQDAAYKESVLPRAARARLAVEAASPFGWERYVGLDGKIIAMPGFGESAPADALFPKFGFTVENVVKAAKEAAEANKI